jgi:hypothetical protein
MAHNFLLGDDVRGNDVFKAKYISMMWGEIKLAAGMGPAFASDPHRYRIFDEESVRGADFSTLDADELNKYSADLTDGEILFRKNQSTWDFFKGVKAGITLGALLGGAGYLLDIVDFGVTAAQAAEFYNNGDPAAGNKLWVEYLFGSVGAITLGAAVGIGIGSRGGPVVGIPASIAAGYLGGKIGEALGRLLYDLNTETLDSFFVDLRATIGDNEGWEAIYKLAEAVVSAAAAASQGSDPGDMAVVGTGNQTIATLDGNDALFGFRMTGGTLNGGAGDDWVVELGGTGVTTYGGAGRDWIFNTSDGGIIYGDTTDGDGIADDVNNADQIWFWAGTTIKDAGKADSLRFYGLPLTGGQEGLPLIVTGLAGFLGAGINELAQAASGAIRGAHFLENRLFTDNFLVNFNYIFEQNKRGSLDMYVFNAFTGLLDYFATGELAQDIKNLKGVVKVEDYEPAATPWGAAIRAPDGSIQKGIIDLKAGDLGMKFNIANPYLGALSLLPPILGLDGRMLTTIHKVLSLADFGFRFAKLLAWRPADDPLILDLDGDGIETSQIGGGVRFDHDANLFAEESGWLSGDDGFLVLDANGNGKIDDGGEFFGGAGQTGAEELAGYDSNGDGKINAADVIWNDLRVWEDADEDGVTDAGELLSLADLGIAEFNLSVTDVGIRTPQGTSLLDKGSFTWASGRTGLFYDAVFQTSTVDTKYTGETGRAEWLKDVALDARGFGSIVDLSVAMSNDPGFGELVTSTAASMSTPKLKTLVEQAGAVLGQWSQVMEDTRELVAVKTAVIGGKTVLQDTATYVEDATGGYYKLKSGAAVVDGTGAVITRPTLADVDAMDGWQVEQAFSPTTRGTAAQFRSEAPYLVRVENARAHVIDYGIQLADGSWTLASGKPIVDDTGQVIAQPTRDDILAQAHATGTEWRTEQVGITLMPLSLLTKSGSISRTARRWTTPWRSPTRTARSMCGRAISTWLWRCRVLRGLVRRCTQMSA